jgi:hypothetical protein
MKGNNNLKEALIHWENGHPSSEGLGTLIDLTGSVEVKVDNPNGTEESFIIGTIDDTGSVCGDKPELLLRGFDGEKQEEILQYLKTLDRPFKLCIFIDGNCLYINANLINFERSEAPHVSEDYWQIKTVFKAHSTLKVYPSGLDISIDYDAYQINKDNLPDAYTTFFEMKAQESAEFWDKLDHPQNKGLIFFDGGNSSH